MQLEKHEITHVDKGICAMTHIDDFQRTEHGDFRLDLDDLVRPCLENLQVFGLVPRWCRLVPSSADCSVGIGCGGCGDGWLDSDGRQWFGSNAQVDLEESRGNAGKIARGEVDSAF